VLAELSALPIPVQPDDIPAQQARVAEVIKGLFAS
jgi:hypothetical protein